MAVTRLEDFLLQSRLRQHFHELSVCSHVNRLRDQFSLAIVDKALRYSFDVVKPVHFPTRIEQDRIGEPIAIDKRLHLVLIFI